MIVVMKPTAGRRERDDVIARIERLGYQVHISEGEERTIIGIVGVVTSGRPIDLEELERLDGVERAVRIARPFKRANREFHPLDTVVEVNGVRIGGREITLMAGPCAVESRDQILAAATAVKESGAQVLRGGAFKPRTSPYSFQGLGEQGLRLLAEAREATGLPVVTEVIAPELVPLVASHADILQVGARNMQNYALLNAVGQAHRPVLLKRGMMSTIEELLMAAEYILTHGNEQVILCERGIRTFETYTRNTLDINAVPLLKTLSHLPVIVDPSHGTGKRDLVEPISRAAVAAGADGLLVEVHPCPSEALSDGDQSLTPALFTALIEGLRPIASAVGRSLGGAIESTRPLDE